MSDSAKTLPRMTVDEFVKWSQTHPGRHELYLGEVVTAQAERISHGAVKLALSIAVRNALAESGTNCRLLPDGATVRIDDRTAFEPDATIHCGPIDFDGVFATNPVVVFEVVSPSSLRIDSVRKFSEYFRVASILHYVIVQIDRRLVVHHRRHGETIESRILNSGTLSLDPPGIELQIGDFFADLPPQEI